MPGPDFFIYLQTETLLPEVERFVHGLGAREPETVLATVLFTDIVGSTERLAELGDRGWRELVERHHALVRQQLVALPRRGDRHRRRRVLRALRRPGPRDPLRAGDLDGRAASSGWRCAPASIPASASWSEDKIAGLAVHIGARVAARAGPARCSSPRP